MVADLALQLFVSMLFLLFVLTTPRQPAQLEVEQQHAIQKTWSVSRNLTAHGVDASVRS
jgi:hypothetical protein